MSIITKKIKNVDELSVAAIRSTCIDGINKSKSGHPGTCLSAAPIMYVLYNYFMKANPYDTKWINRDRFVLSCGHASMLLYTTLHLAGFDLSVEDLKNFRQLHSRTPGHPEIDVTPGVDANSGPLGQGIAQGVGLAMAEEMLRNKYGKEVYDHYTYVMCGDGCLEEGISQEAITFAGLQKLNKLVLLYDKNDVTLDGPLSNSNKEDIKDRFLSAGWDVIYVKNGNNIKDIKKAIKKAKQSLLNPTLIIFQTIIGFGSKNEGSHKVHGNPLGTEDGAFAKKCYGYNYPEFEVPQEVYDNFKTNFINRNLTEYNNYIEKFENLKKTNGELATKILDLSTNDVNKYLNKEHLKMDELATDATRKSSQKVLNFYHELLPNFVGGSADVAGSVMTALSKGSDFTYENQGGTNINWGIREFLMCSASNGILLHGGLRTYTGCFLVFSDYCKAAIRMSALMNLPQIFLFSHDSLVVGEDGPTHQPIEQLAALRSIPNLYVFRPCDAKETYASYRIALESTKTPSCIILTRQNLPLLPNSSNYEGVTKGAYVVDKEKGKKPSMTLIASGSEVSLAIEVKSILEKDGIDLRVVSMPCQELFNQQEEKYQEKVFGIEYEKRVTLEMESTFGWYRYAPLCIGVDKFGASAKADDVVKEFGFTKEEVAKEILKRFKKISKSKKEAK